MNLILYSASDCHLCELAKQVLSHPELNLTFSEKDIRKSIVLADRYGTRIPVLHHEESGKELNWPFTIDDLNDWLSDV